METKVIDIESIEEGMLAADDIKALDGVTIVRKGMEIGGRHITLFKRAVVSKVRVTIPEQATLKENPHLDDYSNNPMNHECLKAAKIMIVDDSKFLRFKLDKAIKQAGLNVVGHACDGQEALDMAKELKPTVITLDIEMPNFDGLSAIKPLIEILPEVIIIMISSVGEEDKILEALVKGAKDFIVKPIDPDKTKKVIMNMIVIENTYKD